MKILLIDDHLLVRDGIGMILQDLEPDLTLLVASRCCEAQSELEAHGDIDLILLDIGLPEVNGIDCLVTIRQRDPLIPVIMLSANERSDIITSSIDKGARGFIPKSMRREDMLSAIRVVLAGGIYVPEGSLIKGVRDKDLASNLTPRQREVLGLLTRGLSNKSIANKLGMAEPTVRRHITSILRTLKVRNRTEAAIAARDLAL